MERVRRRKLRKRIIIDRECSKRNNRDLKRVGNKKKRGGIRRGKSFIDDKRKILKKVIF
jgi:hypothetical protein